MSSDATKMNMAATAESSNRTVPELTVVNLPLGLLGFEQIKRCILLKDPEEAPFMWLQLREDQNHGFLVLPPSAFIEDYEPQISEEDVRFLGLNVPTDALLLNIITIKGPGRATANLKGPIVINRHTLIGKQVIPSNAADLPVGHPLPLA